MDLFGMVFYKRLIINNVESDQYHKIEAFFSADTEGSYSRKTLVI